MGQLCLPEAPPEEVADEVVDEDGPVVVEDVLVEPPPPPSSELPIGVAPGFSPGERLPGGAFHSGQSLGEPTSYSRS